jgi:hypothetical protein
LLKICQVRKANPRRLTLAPNAEKGKIVEVNSQEDGVIGLEQERARDGSMELMSFILYCARGSFSRASAMDTDDPLCLGHRKTQRGQKEGRNPQAQLCPMGFNQGRWEWIRKGVNYLEGLGFTAWMEEVRQLGSRARQIIRSVEDKVDQRSFTEVVKGSVMHRPQGRPVEAARREEDRGLVEHKEDFRRDGDFKRAQRWEGENFNPTLRGSGRNARFYGNQQGRDFGQGGAIRNPGYGDQF